MEPAVEVSANGEIPVPDLPGSGFEVKKGLIESFTIRKIEIRQAL